jgi:predicted glycoside hydrolase/deacetylase ChbG (UPF0249 family)
MTERVLIVNADDFGASEGINRGIVEAHSRGIVTSASMMVNGAAAEHAAALARGHPRLGIGLHWDLDSAGATADLDLGDARAVRTELARQPERFRELMARPPTHLDSHHHVHREPEVAPVARELALQVGRPLRDDGRVSYIGGFYGQWEWGVTDLQHISPEFLIWILRNEVGDGWTEIGCHPGYTGGGFRSVYLTEREVELATLTDPHVRAEIDALGIRLASFAELER